MPVLLLRSSKSLHRHPRPNEVQTRASGTPQICTGRICIPRDSSSMPVPVRLHLPRVRVPFETSELCSSLLQITGHQHDPVASVPFLWVCFMMPCMSTCALLTPVAASGRSMRARLVLVRTQVPARQGCRACGSSGPARRHLMLRGIVRVWIKLCAARRLWLGLCARGS